MKALFFNPYLDILGGGELYTLSWVKFLSSKGYQVILAWPQKEILKKIKDRFSLDLEGVEVDSSFYNFFSQKTSLKEKYDLTRNFDLIFYLSDGSVPFLFGKKNFLHFQVPFNKKVDSNLLNFLKFKFIHKIICNSFFTKSFIDKTYGVNSAVVYPFAQKVFKPLKKKNIILSVGRFDKTLNQKKQEVLIKAFSFLSKKTKSWRLVLVGGSQDQKRLEFLNKLSRGSPVDILPNLSFEKLLILYGQAKIYWQATGFGENLEKNPERAEHFGIAVVEAMASGAVPIVYNGGGMPEIVKEKESGLLFNNLEEFGEFTLQLINSEKKRQSFSKKAQERARKFSEESFFKKIKEVLND